MKVVSILNQKGGVGKTTISINLARAFTLMGQKTILVDADPQGSARDWHVQNKGSRLVVKGHDRSTVNKDVEDYRYTHDWVFIDSPSNLNDSSNSIVTSALKCSDIVLIPVQPSQLDLWSTDSLVDLVMERIKWTDNKLRAAFVVTKKIGNTKIAKEIKSVLEGYGLPVFENGTSQRIIYITSMPEGSTVLDEGDNEAATEIKAIAQELVSFAA